MDGKIKWAAAAVLLAAVVAAGFWLTRPEANGVADADDAVQVALGKKIYAAYCAACHGARLEGQANWRQRLPDGSFRAPPHDDTGHTWHHSDSHLFAYTKSGGKALAPPGFNSTMPGFGSQLGDGDIWAVLAFIKSRWPRSIQIRQAGITARQAEQNR